MKVLQIIALVLGVGIAALSNAQTNPDVVNGSFLNGPNNWAWSQTGVATFPAIDCVSRMVPFQPIWDDVTPIDPFRTSMGRSARVAWEYSDSSNGGTETCRRIEQPLLVPIGSTLKFEGRSVPHGFAVTATTTTTLAVSALDLELGVEIPLTTFTSGSFCGPFDCTAFKQVEVDLSKVWGRRVSLRFTSSFTSQFSGGRMTAYGNQILIDNIRVEKMPVATGSKPTSGQWYNPARSGNGIHLSRSSAGDFLLLWYTYLPSGKAIWYISDVKPMIGGVMSSPIYKSSWNPVTGQNSLTAVGDIRLEMVSGGMNLFWDLYSFNGNNSGFDGGEPFRLLLGGGSYTGLWYEPALSGWGVSIDYKNNTNGVDTIGTVFYYDGTEPVWAQAQAEGAPNSGALWGVTEFTGHGLCPECFAQPMSLVPRVAGALGLSLDANQGWVDITQSSGQFWRRGSPAAPAGIFRLTQP